MTLPSSVWKPNLLMSSSNCYTQTVCRRFTRHWHKSLSDNPSLISILKKRTKSFLKKRDFVTHIAKNQKVITAYKRMITAVNKFKQQLTKHKRNLIMCVAMAFTFDWYKERICIDELIRYTYHLSYSFCLNNLNLKHIFLNIFCVYQRLRQEFGVINKLENKSISNDVKQNEQNRQISNSIVSNCNNIKLSTYNIKNIQNKMDCSYTSCNCSRCRNMNGN